MKKLKFFIFFVCLIFTFQSFSQGYWRLGYNFNYAITPKLKTVVDHFNTERPDFGDPLEYFGLWKGIAFGWGYWWPEYRFGMEALWSNSHDHIYASGFDPVYNVESKWDIKYRHNCLSYAFIFGFRNINNLYWGISLDMDNYRSFKSMNEEKYVWMDKNFIVADRLYLIYEIPLATKFTLQFQPFVQLPWPLVWIEYDLFEDYIYGDYLLGASIIELPVNIGLIATAFFSPKKD